MQYRRDSYCGKLVTREWLSQLRIVITVARDNAASQSGWLVIE